MSAIDNKTIRDAIIAKITDYQTAKVREPVPYEWLVMQTTASLIPDFAELQEKVAAELGKCLSLYEQLGKD